MEFSRERINRTPKEEPPAKGIEPEKSRGEIKDEAKKWLEEKGIYKGSGELMEKANNWLKLAKQRLISEKEAKIWYLRIQREIDRRWGDSTWCKIDKNLNDLANKKLKLEHEYGKWGKVPIKGREEWERKHDLVYAEINYQKEMKKGVEH